MTLFILQVLAVYRLARLIALEEGPGEIFTKLRSRLGGDTQETSLGRGICCPLCIGVWLAALVVLVTAMSDFHGNAADLAIRWLAVAGGQALLYVWSEGH